MHLQRVTLLNDRFPTDEHYPFNLDVLRQTPSIEFTEPVTFFVGENGAGKSTLLEALAHKCGIHIWRDVEGARYTRNPYEKRLYRYIDIRWENGHVPGAFFAASIFNNFAQYLDEWAAADPRILDYFGGKSLITQSHGQSLMSFFRARFKIKGIYLLDEPETALSPTSQLKLLRVLREMSLAGHAQFIIATHSPILLSCPGAAIYSFDRSPLNPIPYEETDHYRIYKDFMEDPGRYLDQPAE